MPHKQIFSPTIDLMNLLSLLFIKFSNILWYVSQTQEKFSREL